MLVLYLFKLELLAMSRDKKYLVGIELECTMAGDQKTSLTGK